MKHLLTSVVLASAMFSVGAFAGPSAKFAAVYGDDGPYLEVISVIEDATVDTGPIVNSKNGYTFATIKVPNNKELLVGVSAEIGIVTDTSIKGKLGGSARAIAEGGAYAQVCAVHTGTDTVEKCAHPGWVTLSRRIQELEATLGGVIESCEDFTGAVDPEGDLPGDPNYDDTPDGVINIALECIVTDEEIGLVLDTLAAHHFNYVIPNLATGEYDIRAYFMTKTSAEVDIDEVSIADCPVEQEPCVSASAFAQAFIGKYMVTVQQVRAVKGDIPNRDIIEILD
jgi:hypothetical protein